MGTSNTDQAMPKAMQHPIAPQEILRKRRAIKEVLLRRSNLIPVRVAILGGSTTCEVRSILELFLLAHGFQPAFYESGYNSYSEDVVFENPALWNFKPDVVFIHTTWRNVMEFPEVLASEADVELRVQSELSRFLPIWEKLQREFGAMVIQNNFDLPHLRPLGNLEASESFGQVSFLHRLNAEFAAYARRHPRFMISDILYLSSQLGLAVWSTPNYWYRFHMAVSPTATVELARNIAGLIKAAYGRSKKCLILDLDNTLWGGVIGDDGVQNLVLGRDHPVGEAFLDFQRYVKELKRRGVILAVCSKNEPESAMQGFSHPDSILKLDDFSAFKANWNPKPDNIREIAAELNIGLDSLVFVDDNPAERALVERELPQVAVPEVGSDVAFFEEILEGERFFEAQRIVKDDLERSAYYRDNIQRNLCQASCGDYGEFLASLEMSAETGPFIPVYLERITQLINKTNQFNLTTRRYTIAEVEEISRDSSYLTLYGRLADRFGDNGLVSVMIGHLCDGTVDVDLWVMSCRVFKREMELAMFDALVEECRARGIQQIVGTYIPSKKNGLVAELYPSLGFELVATAADGRQRWQYDVPETYTVKASHIRRTAAVAVATA
jgi:FkbH-like protein